MILARPRLGMHNPNLLQSPFAHPPAGSDAQPSFDELVADDQNELAWEREVAAYEEAERSLYDEWQYGGFCSRSVACSCTARLHPRGWIPPSCAHPRPTARLARLALRARLCVLCAAMHRAGFRRRALPCFRCLPVRISGPLVA